MKTLIYNAKNVMNDAVTAIVVENAKIVELFLKTPTKMDNFDQTIDAKGLYLSAGFIDTHTHGAGGHDFMDGSLTSILKACRAHMGYGTTSIIPTTLSSNNSELYKTLTLMEEAIKVTENMPNILGVHLEGPYFAPTQYGAQDNRYLKAAKKEDYLDLLDRFPSIIKWSSAPEIEGTLEMARELKLRGIVPSIGHSDSTEKEVALAVNNGYTMVTHIFNAMSRLTRSNAIFSLGLAESALIEDRLIVEVIADGCHLPPSLLRLIYKCKGADGMCLVTDSMRAAGLDVKESIIGSLKDGQRVEIADGVAFMPGKRSFGGSIATTDRLVRTMYKLVKLPLSQAVKMMTETPARSINIFDKKGSVEIGKDADIVLFDDNVNIKLVMVMGKIWKNNMSTQQ